MNAAGWPRFVCLLQLLASYFSLTQAHTNHFYALYVALCAHRYIRAIGFLYLRYTADADTLWEWFSDYLDDPEPVKVKIPSAAPTMPLGQYLRMLITVRPVLNVSLPSPSLFVHRSSFLLPFFPFFVF